MNEKKYFIDTSIILDSKESHRHEDANGFLCISNNPIAKAGIFEYSGQSLGLSQEHHDKIFKVYRSFDELKKTAKLMQGIPLILNHEWINGDASNPTIMGIVSGEVRAEEPYLYADIKIINDEARKAIESGEQRELSPGYYSTFVEESGEFNGEEYNFIQKDLLYNHLALVAEGRSGPDLRILDSKESNKDVDTDILKNKSINKREGITEMKKRKISDSKVEELKQLLIEFLNEEEKEPAHQEQDEEEENTPVSVDVENEEKAKDEEEKATDNEEEEKSTDEEEKSEDEETEDEEEEKSSEKTTDARELVRSAINEYKKEHGRAVRAYDEVAQVVGNFKTFDSKGNILSEKAIYKTACARLGLDKVAGIADYKSAFKTAAYLRSQDGLNFSKKSKSFDSANIKDDATVDGLINKFMERK